MSSNGTLPPVDCDALVLPGAGEVENLALADEVRAQGVRLARLETTVAELQAWVTRGQRRVDEEALRLLTS